MKKIYFVLTYTGTILSKIVHIYTKKEYSHSSISLDENLNRMYSFGRYNPYNPFRGGFIKENINEGTFKRFYNTKSVIFCLQITDEQYNVIEQEIKKFISNKDQYKFNILGLCAVLFNIKIKRKNKFYCSEFVKYLLDKAKVQNNLPVITIPQDFAKMENVKLMYQGKLNTFKI